MRAAVVYFAEKQAKSLEEISKSLAKGLEKKGASVDVFNAKDFSRKLAIYQLVLIGTEPAGTFGGKIPEGLSKFLDSSGPLMNTKSYGFIVKKGFRCEKSLQVLMRTMENEGMFIVCSDVLGSSGEAVSAGEGLVD